MDQRPMFYLYSSNTRAKEHKQMLVRSHSKTKSGPSHTLQPACGCPQETRLWMLKVSTDSKRCHKKTDLRSTEGSETQRYHIWLRKSLQCWRLRDVVLPCSPLGFFGYCWKTCGLTLLFGAVSSGLFGHHQPCMQEPGPVSSFTEKPDKQANPFRTLPCDFIQNLLPLFQCSTPSPFLTLRRPGPSTPFRETRPEHCKASCTCLPRRCLLGFPMPITIITSKVSQSQTTSLTPHTPWVPHCETYCLKNPFKALSIQTKQS